jgi:beta propeller repeat protein
MGNDLIYCDYGFSNPAQQLYRSELFVYNSVDATEVQITNSNYIKSQPKINGRFVLYRENAGCSSTFEVNLTLMSRATGDSTVVSECEQNPETHSLGDRWAAWTARPLPDLGNKKVHVLDLETGVITLVSPEAPGQQFFPHTDDDHVIWEDSRDGQREVYLHTFSTGEEECLTPDGWEQGWPTLRNGLATWCDYQYSQQSGEYAPCDVVVYELLTRTLRRVTATSDRWMPRFVDSGWILYGQSIWQSGSFKLYAHDLVGDGIITPDGHVVP